MNLLSLLEISKIVYGSEDLFCMFQDYALDKRLDRDLLNKRILSALGTNAPLYTVCETFKAFLDCFFLDHREQITKLVDTLYFEYNPIWNKDGTEKRTITTSRETTHERESENADTTHHTGTDTTKHTGTDTTTDTGTNTGSVSADNVSTWQNDTRTATDNTNTRTANLSDARTANLTDATTGTSNESGTQTEAETVTDEFITQGNIGLTSTQQLINEQRALMEFDIYDWIIQKLKVDMFLLVY